MSKEQGLIEGGGFCKKRIFWPVMRHYKELQQTAEIQLNGGRIYALQGKKVGEILNDFGVIDLETLHAVEQHHKTKKPRSKPIGEILMQMNIIEAEELTRALCVQSGVLMADLALVDIPKSILDLIPFEQAKITRAIPIAVCNQTLYLAVANPNNVADKQHLALITKLNIRPVYVPAREIDSFIETTWKNLMLDVWTGSHTPHSRDL